ncbi:hypothetical protein NLG97_g9344 [Lecanicillium saksenae]|uniref:Uncharacterized protein n=1 Tax=Lecanicillium saksenae TaxID=468837 RepID=A0ACC1QGA6_9HYPO|nr:hypothetical protein NLG97_g9344 [Lecanicillium saksenae]
MTSDSPIQKKPTPTAAPPQPALQKPIARSASVAVRPTPSATASVQPSRPQARPETPDTPKFENVRGYSDFNASRPRPVSTNFDTRQQSLPDRSKISTQSVRPSSRDGSEKPPNGTKNLDYSKRGSGQVEANHAHARSDDRPRDGALGDAFSKFEQKSNNVVETKQSGQSWKFSSDDIIIDGKDEDSGDDSDEMTPETRRERERLQLEEEEQRVAAAQSEYRQRLVGVAQGKKPVPGPKPSSIQNRMQACRHCS